MDRINECFEWLRYADEDIEAAGVLNLHHRRPLNIICYHCQQSAEKYLKAYLVSKNVTFEKTHDLLKILTTCQDVDPSFEDIVTQCKQLNPYSVITRYPSELELIEDDADNAIESANHIKKCVNEKINENFAEKE